MTYTTPDPGDNGGGGTGTGTGPATPPTQSNGFQSILAYNLNLLSAARVDVEAKWKQAFSAGSANWCCQLKINGTIVDDIWAGGILDSPVLLGSTFLAAGTYQVVVLWQGASSIQVVRPRMKLSWAFK